MRNEEDVRGVKQARAEFSKRGIDVSRADLRVAKGILTVRGMVSFASRSGGTDMKHDLEVVSKSLRSKAEIKHVIIEVSYTGMRE